MQQESLIELIFKKIPSQILALLKRVEEEGFTLRMEYKGMEHILQSLLKIASLTLTLWCIIVFAILSTILIIKGKVLFASIMYGFTAVAVAAFLVMLFRR